LKKIRLIHPITHDGIHYDRGVYELEDDVADSLLAVHSPTCTSYEPADVKRNLTEKPQGECRNHSAIPFVEVNPIMGKATPAPDAKKTALAAAGVQDAAVPDSSGPGKAVPAPDAQPKKKAS
jgi:hypothetical protein